MAANRVLALVIVTAAFAMGFAAAGVFNPPVTEARTQSNDRVWELRTYTANEGKLDDLQARFRDHAMRIFARHGMGNVGYWVPQDAPLSENTLIYILEHESRDAATQSWDHFRNDTEWGQVVEESSRHGRLVSSVDVVFMEATDYSPIK